MKKIALLIWFCSLYLGSSGQAYKTVFGHDTTQWNVKMEIPDYIATIVYKAFSDTLIGGYNYKKVFECSNSSYIDKVGYMREDTSSGKLWFLLNNGEEKLVLDLEINKGDTFLVEENYECMVDTTYTKNELRYVVFNCNLNYSDTLKFIESIGPNNIFGWLNNWELGKETTLLCCYKDNIQVYENSNLMTCFLQGGDIRDDEMNSSICIFPNPNNGSFTIGLKSQFLNDGSYIQIINGFGELVKTIEHVENSQRISISELANGYYYLRVRTYHSVITTSFIKISNP